MTNKISAKFAGPAGTGIFTVGEFFAKILKGNGLSVSTSSDYPSLIKGGHNQMDVRAEDREVTCTIEMYDVLVAVDQLSIDLHEDSLEKGGVIISSDQLSVKDSSIKHIKLPFQELTDKPIYYNTVALGALLGLAGISVKQVEHLYSSKFSNKGKDIVKENIMAAQAGHDFTVKIGIKSPFKIRRYPDSGRLLISGNDAACLGALKAGVKFVAEYPMTPSSSILSFMAAHEQTHNVVVKQTEDELAAMNMLVGAGFAGCRCMTATSGGGFALMTEGLGFAAMAEVPVVIYISSRAGPSTGVPTYTEQSDFKFALHASQGEFPRIIIAPGDPTECFYESFNAFNLAEKYQVPVIILLDKHISNSKYTVPRFKDSNLRIDRGKLLRDVPKDFKRYKLTQDGVSPRCIPGQENGIHIASSYEHDETGWTSEDGGMVKAQKDKRGRKLDSMPKDILAPRIYGCFDSPDLTIVSWGSNKGVIMEAMKQLPQIKIKYVHVVYMNPLPIEEIIKSIEGHSLIIEGNQTGQLMSWIYEKTRDFHFDDTFFKYDGRPFYLGEVIEKIRGVMDG